MLLPVRGSERTGIVSFLVYLEEQVPLVMGEGWPGRKISNSHLGAKHV